jgi:hypothetical protein
MPLFPFAMTTLFSKVLEEYRKMFEDGRLEQLLRAVEKVNPGDAEREDLEI